MNTNRREIDVPILYLPTSIPIYFGVCRRYIGEDYGFQGKIRMNGWGCEYVVSGILWCIHEKNGGTGQKCMHGVLD